MEVALEYFDVVSSVAQVAIEHEIKDIGTR